MKNPQQISMSTLLGFKQNLATTAFVKNERLTK